MLGHKFWYATTGISLLLLLAGQGCLPSGQTNTNGPTTTPPTTTGGQTPTTTMGGSVSSSIERALENMSGVRPQSITISRQTNTHVRGLATIRGTRVTFFATNVRGNWEIVHSGTQVAPCELMRLYSFPSEMSTDCSPVATQLQTLVDQLRSTANVSAPVTTTPFTQEVQSDGQTVQLRVEGKTFVIQSMSTRQQQDIESRLTQEGFTKQASSTAGIQYRKQQMLCVLRPANGQPGSTTSTSLTNRRVEVGCWYLIPDVLNEA